MSIFSIICLSVCLCLFFFSFSPFHWFSLLSLAVLLLYFISCVSLFSSCSVQCHQYIIHMRSLRCVVAIRYRCTRYIVLFWSLTACVTVMAPVHIASTSTSFYITYGQHTLYINSMSTNNTHAFHVNTRHIGIVHTHHLGIVHTHHLGIVHTSISALPSLCILIMGSHPPLIHSDTRIVLLICFQLDHSHQDLLSLRIGNSTQL